MKQYHTRITIRRPRKAVWEALTDFAAYPDWNPLVGRLTGDFRTGGTITTYIKPLGRAFNAELLHGECFTELFSALISKKLLGQMEAAFVAHNEALKQRLEKAS